MTSTSTPTDEQLDAIINLAKQQAELLRRMVGLVDPVWLEAQAHGVVARALGENPDAADHTPAFTDVVFEEVYTEADRDLFDQVWHELQHELGDDDIADTTDDTNV